jgi:selenocysteine lyase/cysteine desulfurase
LTIYVNLPPPPLDRQDNNLQENQLPYAYLNSASLSIPSDAVRQKAFSTHKRIETLSVKSQTKIYEDTREKAKQLLGLTHSEYVVFGRNATEASSLCYWLADLKKDDRVLCSNIEHDSMQNIFLYHQDHGNDKRTLNKSSWPFWFYRETQKFELMDSIPTEVNLDFFGLHDLETNTLKQTFRNLIHEKTKAVLISHVRRDTGQAIPVNKIISLLRSIKPNLFILVDGTQAMGNLPKVNFDLIDCNAYVASPHKTLNSEVIGVLYLNPKYVTKEQLSKKLQNLSPFTQQKIITGMLSSKLNIPANSLETISPSDTVGFLEVLKRLPRQDASTYNFVHFFKKRRAIKKEFLNLFGKITAYDNCFKVEVPQKPSQTPFILSLKVIGQDYYELAEKLSSLGCFVTATFDKSNPQDKFLRLSFQHSTKRKEIHYFIKVLQGLLKSGI